MSGLFSSQQVDQGPRTPSASDLAHKPRRGGLFIESGERNSSFCFSAARRGGGHDAQAFNPNESHCALQPFKSGAAEKQKEKSKASAWSINRPPLRGFNPWNASLRDRQDAYWLA